MCGIMGYVGERQALFILLQGLEKIEYRGYDSSGIALCVQKKIHLYKSKGKLEAIKKLTQNLPSAIKASKSGIGHTRWATHGEPSTKNAHPHKVGHLVLVHNGIIENYLELKEELGTLGLLPLSDTDTEVLALLILSFMNQGLSLKDATKESFKKTKGQSSILVLSEKEEGVIIGICNGSPLIIGQDPKGGTFFASDIQPLMPYTKDITFLLNQDLVEATKEGFQIYSLLNNQKIKRKKETISWTEKEFTKNGYAHFMLKEIFEQPQALRKTMTDLVSFHPPIFKFLDSKVEKKLSTIKRLTIVACGSSFYAAHLAKYWIEEIASLPVTIELASEYRYKKPLFFSHTLFIGLSQSGETADTLSAFSLVKGHKNLSTLGISNVRGSSLERIAEQMIYLSAGPEIGVASTKSFSSQLLALLLIGLKLAQNQLQNTQKLQFELLKIPKLLEHMLQDEKLLKKIKEIAFSLEKVKGFFFIGRGYSYPLALEGALKLKEISYEPSEGYAAGELKHGPLALIDNTIAVVVIAPSDHWKSKTLSNLQEVKARKAIIISITAHADEEAQNLSDYFIEMPQLHNPLNEIFSPFFITPILQLLSYYRGLYKKTDIDQPRNLAKSVTVE